MEERGKPENGGMEGEEKSLLMSFVKEKFLFICHGILLFLNIKSGCDRSPLSWLDSFFFCC